MTPHIEIKGMSISQGSLRDSDILQAMVDWLDWVGFDKLPERVRPTYKVAKIVIEKYGDFGYVSYLDPEVRDEIQWLIHEQLFSSLNAMAPDGFYFGAHPGDGSLLGFWPTEECDE